MGNLTKKVASIAISVATIATLSGLMPVAAYAQSSDLQTQINALLAQIATLQSKLGQSSGSSSSYNYTRNLTVGSKGDDVKALQMLLKSQSFLAVEPTGFFGALTKAALAKYQSANGISPASGYFGPKTRAAVSAVAAAPAPAPAPGAPAPVPAGAGLSVVSASQPAATIAPASASRIPFTVITLTAGTSDVTVTGVQVQRTGLADDAAFSGVVLIDENMTQVGIAKTLNSDHKATVGEKKVVKAGTSVMWTIAANRAAAGARGGQTASFDVLGVNVDGGVPVSGSFPMRGATHTVNETLSIGSVTMARGPLDPAAGNTKEIGTKAYVFTSVKVTAGSAERVYLKSMRWNQVGSAGAGDLANVKTFVDSDAYDTTVSSDGKYYTTVFPGNGVLIDKGFSKEVSARGDIVGGSARTIDFDLAKRVDIYLVGETYGYGIIPPQTGAAVPTVNTAAFSSGEDPWYDAARHTISSGTITISADSAGVSAQNVALNLADQVIGGWLVDVKGESVSVGSMVYNLFITLASAGAAGLGDLNNITLYNRDTGAVLAGPIDGTGATTLSGSITFTNTITFPVGVTKMVMKGKYSATTGFVNNDTLAASTTPSSQWTSVTGVATGVTITPSPTSAVSGNTMTVKGPAMTISVSSVPIAQTIIAGVSQFTFANYILDQSASGEDLRLTSLPVEYSFADGAVATDLTNCKLYDGSSVLNTGTNVLNPSAKGSSTAIVFDGSGLLLAKGTSKQLALKCDARSGAAASSKYQWGYDVSSSPSPTGVVSGQAATVTENDNPGQQMTVATGGALAIALDASSPSYAVASPGQVVELAKLKYSATNEDVSVKQVALILTQAASNSPVDLVGQKVTLWDGSMQIGEAVFSSGDNATSSAIVNFMVPKDGSKILTVKGTIAGISASGPLTASGDLVAADYDGANTGVNGNYGTGVASGSTVTPTGATTASNGVRVMRAYPSLSKVDFSSGETLLAAGSDQTLYKFKVTANNGDVALYKFSFSVSSSTASASVATTSKFSLYVFTDSAFSAPDPSYNSANNANGLVNSGQCYNGLVSNTAGAGNGGTLGTNSAKPTIYVDRTGCNKGTTTLIIPSGQTRWLRLAASIGTLAPSGTAENVQAQLEGDAAYPANANVLMQKASGVDGDANKDFIWSPISTTTSNTKDDLDWTNGYGVPGLPGTNMTPSTLSK